MLAKRMRLMTPGSNARQLKIGMTKEHTLLKGYAEIMKLCDMRIALLRSEIEYGETASAMFEVRSALEGIPTSAKCRFKRRAKQEMANTRAQQVFLEKFEKVKSDCQANFENAIKDYPETWKQAFRKRYLELKGLKKIQEEMGISSEEFAPIKRRMKKMEEKDGQKTQYES